MTALPKHLFTPEEYLQMEVEAEYKSQYLSGEIFAMAGGQRYHNLLASNVSAALSLRFRGRSCEVYASDMRVSVLEGEMYTYPDVVAICGEPEFDGGSQPHSLLNPQVVIEVLSPTTEAFDRGEKFARYRKLNSLRDYVLVSVERMLVEHHELQPNGVWMLHQFVLPSHVLRLASIDCEVPLSEIYDKVK